ncbi:molecular chaperone DnaJ [[Mycoplasma] mobile]|uniref:Chaperone protein DnaJ n=1 Tax=Mycoplasma mobile (strain ATCC 43663 / 163K / NCTC 11711) TaxID=267748 RepID=DNAJ_MYCM1|nr:molecular chaperone DnaJ [[Mycoplasma] mobile]Q6KHF9.1 RecName: Full=Chaperone protein DnaJ [Mycoplasma mobile 163K]AAT27971.1 heat shock protein DnaJ [Mycoplasma mobile 163K]
MKKDYYEILGLTKSASKDEIKKAYRTLAKTYHPDVNKETNAEEKFKEITEAYEILNDDVKREQYNQFGHAAFDPNAGGFGGQNPFTNAEGFSGFSDFSGFGSIFTDFFGGFGNSQRANPNRAQRGEDRHAVIKISFIDSVLGKEIVEPLEKFETCNTCNGSGAKSQSDIITCTQCSGMGEQIKITKTFLGQMQQNVICSKCNGIGKEIVEKCLICKGKTHTKTTKNITIKIPAGIQNGQTLRVENYGNAGLNGGSNGNLILSIKVSPHKHFVRKNNDIILRLPVSIKSVIGSEKVEVPTPYGFEIIKIDPNIKTGDELIIKNKGIITKYESGKMIVIFEIFIPKLTSFEKKEISTILEKNADKFYEKWIKEFE